jgi:hypothetical protein
MINKLSSSSKPSYTPRSQEWTVSGSPSQNTSSTGTQAWGVVTAAKPVETRREEAPTQTALTPTPRNTLNLLGGYRGNMLGNSFTPNTPAFTPPDWTDPQTVATIETLDKLKFMPVQPSLAGVPLNTTGTSTPYSGANDSLGSSMFSNIMGSLGLGKRNNFVT